MKINWSEIGKGVSSELDKVAFSFPKLGPKGKAIAAGAGLAGAGAAGAGYVGGMINKNVGGALSGMADYLPMLTPFLGGNKGARPTGNPIIHVTTQKPPGILDLPSNQMGGFGDPNLGQSFAKTADIVTHALTRAVQNRLANKAIDSVLSPGDIPQAAMPTSEDKKLEIVSKYPEMAKLLEKEENKAYLEKLLKE